MCGRFGFAPRKNLTSRYKIQIVTGDLIANYNTAPGMMAPVVIKAEEGNEIVQMKWGLQLGLQKPGSKLFAPINAKSETIFEKPIFSHLLGNRCLIPVIGFYEWKKNESKKQPYFIHLKEDDYFSLAGIYKTIKDEAGLNLSTFTILTTSANDIMQPIHDRMPVILKKETEDLWLDNKAKVEFDKVFQPFKSELMDIYPVSNRVNYPMVNDEELIKRV
ncbi:MAG: SOS response-associated peptidase [bacterium]